MRREYILSILLFLLLLFSVACSDVRSPADINSGDVSLERKIGQMIMIGFRGVDIANATLISEKQVARGEIGGVLILPYNIENRKQLLKSIKDIKSIKRTYPLLVAIDQEGGKICRLNDANGFTSFPSSKEVARSRTPRQAFKLYLKMAGIIKETGVNLNLAPVVDLDVNPDSPAIGRIERSFSADPNIVLTYAEQFIPAHRETGVLTSIKHYPGHGSAGNDTHLGLTDITGSWRKIELIPYMELIKKGLVDTVMTAHVVNTDVDDKYPASLSEKHVEENLRDRLGFDGVIITDDLQMGAVSNIYPLEDIVIKAINSGSDILLFANYFNPDPEIPRKVRKIVIQAIKEGKIKRERVEESFQRIMRLKKRLS